VAVIVVVLWYRARNAERYASILEADRGASHTTGILGGLTGPMSAGLSVVTPGIAGELGAPHVSAATGLPSFEIPEIDWRRFN